MRYDTLGDWKREGDTDVIEVYDLYDDDYTMMIAIHELIEWYLCKKNGITQQQVDDWDFAWMGEGEPGDSPDAPYRWEHVTAMGFEEKLCNRLHIDWKTYLDYTNNVKVKVNPEKGTPK
jgi:hypothetical protein